MQVGFLHVLLESASINPKRSVSSTPFSKDLIYYLRFPQFHQNGIFQIWLFFCLRYIYIHIYVHTYITFWLDKFFLLRDNELLGFSPYLHCLTLRIIEVMWFQSQGWVQDLPTHEVCAMNKEGAGSGRKPPQPLKCKRNTKGREGSGFESE